MTAEEAATPPAWTKWSENVTADQDSSNGDDSFGNTSAKSFASFLTDAETEDMSVGKSMIFDMTDMADNHNLESKDRRAQGKVENEMLEMRMQLQLQTDSIRTLSGLTKSQALMISTLTNKMEQMTMSRDQTTATKDQSENHMQIDNNDQSTIGRTNSHDRRTNIKIGRHDVYHIRHHFP